MHRARGKYSLIEHSQNSQMSQRMMQHIQHYLKSKSISNTTSSTCKRFFHSTFQVESSTSQIHSFRHAGALHFIISSSQKASAEDHQNSKKPRVYSPALFVSNEEKQIISQSADSNDNKDIDIMELFHEIPSVIEHHYAIENQDQFVGGMGENDGGVWFVVDENDYENDTLDYWEQIRGKWLTSFNTISVFD